ncbi:MAG: hypothetical protein RML12_08905 [Xanthomonadales bacterium]|nr:hypothetical protein [Xanthomonadales bacterium]
MPILLTILLLADPGTAEAAPEACAPPAAESRAEAPQPYVSPATPPGEAELDRSRRFYFDARRKMTAADFDAWLASLGARVVGSDEAAAAGTADDGRGRGGGAADRGGLARRRRQPAAGEAGGDGGADGRARRARGGLAAGRGGGGRAAAGAEAGTGRPLKLPAQAARRRKR